MYVFGNGDISLVLVESESNKIRISAKTPAPYMCSATHQLVKGATCLELTDAPLGNIPGCGPDIKVIPVIRTNSNRMRFVFKILHPLQKNPPREVLLLTNKNLDRCELYSRLRTGVLRWPLEDGHRRDAADSEAAGDGGGGGAEGGGRECDGAFQKCPRSARESTLVGGD